MEKMSNNEVKDDVVSEIYKTFSVGQRYSKKNIKDTLNDLYQRLGYQKKAKATDLELYYLMKSVYLTADKQNGFELIGKR
jgi:dissimilatory sulfite reductase (desulfoviridin) alpha/beta subunit